MASTRYKNSLETLSGQPIVIWASDPIRPGEIVALFGDGFSKKVKVFAWRLDDRMVEKPVSKRSELPQRRGEQLEVLQQDHNCIKALLPDNWQLGCFVIQIRTSSNCSEPIYLNKAELIWMLGDNGDSVSPGRKLNLFGKNFLIDKDRECHVILQSTTGQINQLTIQKREKYTVTCKIPLDLNEGNYRVFIHNGHGGQQGWSKPLNLAIRQADIWPQTVYNVKNYGAKGDGEADDTDALRSALKKANTNGGGIVYIPRGTYKITGQLTIPSCTVLRGEKREIVWLYVPKEIPEFNSVIAGNGKFGVENLSIVAQTPRRLITAPDIPSMYKMPWGGYPPPSIFVSDVFLRCLRLQHLRYAHRVGRVEDDPRRSEDVGPSTVTLAGSHLEISDCDIVSSGMPIIIQQTRHSIIQRNHLHTGRNGWYGIWGAWETVFENNLVEGRDLEGSYGGFSNYGNGTKLARLYIAHNEFRNGFGGEREAITFDTPGLYPWVGNITAGKKSGFTITDAKWESNAFVGLAALIIAGKGVGQHRCIRNNGRNEVALEKPWDIIPDSTSVIAIQSYRCDVIIYANKSQDTSVGVQLWGGSYNFIIDNNYSHRTGGLWGTGTQNVNNHFLPCFFTQWLNNKIEEGFIYQQGPTPDDLHAALGVFSRQGIPQPQPSGTAIRVAVIRNNQVADGTSIVATYYGTDQLTTVIKKTEKNNGKLPFSVPPAKDIIIEGNIIKDTPVGINIGLHFLGTLIRNNKFKRVVKPIQDFGSQTLIMNNHD